MEFALVPYFEIKRLVKLIVEHFYVKFNIEIDINKVDVTFIPPREDVQAAVELVCPVVQDTNTNLIKIRVYIFHQPNYDFILDDFKIEQVENTDNVVGNTRYVSIAILPRSVASEGAGPPPPPPPPPAPLTIGFDPTYYRVFSGQIADVILTISDYPTERVTASFDSFDFTAIANVDYEPVAGTVTWEVNDNTPKHILIQTGDLRYYYWTPACNFYYDTQYYYDLHFEFFNSDMAIDGSTLNVHGYNQNSQQIYMPPFSTKIAPVPLSETVYHEFEITTLDDQLILKFLLNINVYTTTSVYPDVYNAGLTIRYSSGERSGYIVTYKGAFFNSPISNDIYISDITALPFRVGVLIDSDNKFKMHINGYWIDFNTSQITQDVNLVTSYDINADGGLGLFAILNKTRLKIRFAFEQNVDYIAQIGLTFNDSNFSAMAYFGNDQLYRPVGALSPAGNGHPTAGGRFGLELLNPVNAEISSPSATVEIQDTISCYPKVLLPFTLPPDQQLKYYLFDTLTPIQVSFTQATAFLDWTNSEGVCGEIQDLRSVVDNRYGGFGN